MVCHLFQSNIVYLIAAMEQMETISKLLNLLFIGVCV